MRIADMHCDTLSALLHKGGSLLENDLDIDLQKLRAGQYGLLNMAAYVCLPETADPYAQCLAMIDLYDREMEKWAAYIAPARSYGDIVANEKAGKISAVLTVEEGGVCGGSLDRLRQLYARGVRMMTFTWNYPNELGYPNFDPDAPSPNFHTPDTRRGLTERGVAFLAEMERLGMVADVSHLSDAGFWDVARHATRPFVASHSNARALCPHVRNLTDDMIRALGEKGGLAGGNCCGAFLVEGRPSTIEDLCRHLVHVMNVGGVEVAALGLDLDGVDGDQAVADASQALQIFDGLKALGVPEDDIDRVLYGNVRRLYRETLTK